MKKEAIIDIIVTDLKEIELLLGNFKDGDKIEGEFIDLLNTKYQNISKEITLLNFWREDKKPEEQPRIEQEKVAVTEQQQPIIIAEEKAEVPTAEPEPVVAPEPVAPEPQPVETRVEAKPIPVVEEAKQPVEVVEAKPVAQEMPASKPAEPAKRTAKASDLTNYGTPVSDIKKAIAIADRFLFQKELFGGNATDFNNAIETANGMTTYEEAERYLLATYGWDIESKTTEAFLKAVHRKFL